MKFKQWFENTERALPDDPENNGLTVGTSLDPSEIVDAETGRRKKLVSRKADKIFGKLDKLINKK